MGILQKLLNKRGINKIEDLSSEEQLTYRNWERTLTGETVTIESLKEFCNSQIRLIENKFASKGENGDDNYLKACLHVYLNLKKAMEAPEAERASLEQHLTQLIQ